MMMEPTATRCVATTSGQTTRYTGSPPLTGSDRGESSLMGQMRMVESSRRLCVFWFYQTRGRLIPVYTLTPAIKKNSLPECGIQSSKRFGNIFRPQQKIRGGPEM